MYKKSIIKSKKMHIRLNIFNRHDFQQDWLPWTSRRLCAFTL
jgi:hypothetical protein